MAYEGAHPLLVKNGMTGASTLTGALIGNGVSAVTANAITQYNVLVGGASNAISNIAPSTAGQAFTSNGASSNPSFQAVTGNTMVFLSTQSASASSSIDFTSLISASYSAYRVILYNVMPNNAGADLTMLISTNNGSSWISSNYQSGNNRANYNGTSLTNGNSTSSILIASSMTNNNSNCTCCGYMDLYNIDVAILPQIAGQCTYFTSSGTVVGNTFSGTNTSNNTVNAIRFIMSSGTMTTGTFALYGIKES